MNQPYYQPPPNQKPGMVTAIAVGTLVVGILNILLGLGWAAALLMTIVCWPLGAYSNTLGILEIIYAAKLLGNPPRPVQPAKYIAIMEICNILFGSVWSLALGIFALVAYNDPAVQAYFAWLNSGTQAPVQNYPSNPQQ